jgi:hypothetical protein
VNCAMNGIDLNGSYDVETGLFKAERHPPRASEKVNSHRPGEWVS